jgi:hypothetical protein
MPGKYVIGKPEIDKEIDELAKKYSTQRTETRFQDILSISGRS